MIGRVLILHLCLSIHQIEDDLLITVAEGEISYTIDVVEDEYGDDELSYSSQSIGVTCV
jgi:hypothetical protein